MSHSLATGDSVNRRIRTGGRTAAESRRASPWTRAADLKVHDTPHGQEEEEEEARGASRGGGGGGGVINTGARV